MAEPLLRVSDLRTSFQVGTGRDERRLRAVDGVSFAIESGQTLGLVGESGCGKSVTAMSLVGLLPKPAGVIEKGSSIEFAGQELTACTPEQLRLLRGAQIGVIFQEPMTALNPVHRIGDQLMELFRIHGESSRAQAQARSLEALEMVGIPAAKQRMREYPHQLSGGMRQRVVIALALALRPQLVIADEPTTALDVTVQAQILELLSDLQKETGASVLLITHDLGVIAEACEQVVVMYAGRIVEKASVEDLFANARHAYTRALLSSIPRLDHPRKTVLPTIPGQVPALAEMPQGCRFGPRSGLPCGEENLRVRSPLVEVAPGHWVESCPVCSAPVAQQEAWLQESSAHLGEHLSALSPELASS